MMVPPKTDRRQKRPDAHLVAWRDILQADAYGGYNGLYDPARPGRAGHAGPIPVAASSSSPTLPRVHGAGLAPRPCRRPPWRW